MKTSKKKELIIPMWKPELEQKMIEEFYPEWKEKIEKRYSPTTAQMILTIENCKKDWIIVKLGLNKPTLM